jgi:hypothetical protein
LLIVIFLFKISLLTTENYKEWGGGAQRGHRAVMTVFYVSCLFYRYSRPRQQLPRLPVASSSPLKTQI